MNTPSHGISPENVRFIDGELTRLRKEIDSVDAELATVQEPGDAILGLERATDEIWRMAQNFRERYEEADAAERQRILRPFLRQITVHPEEKRVVVELFKVPVPEEVREHTGRLVPPTRIDTKRSAGCDKKTRILRLFYKTGEVVSVG